MSDIFSICGAGLCAFFAVSVIREMKKEYTLSVILGVCVIFLAYCIPRVIEAASFIKETAAYADSSHTSVLLRGLGITYLTSTASDICRSSGENAIAGYIETAGRAEILILCVPMFKELLSLALF